MFEEKINIIKFNYINNIYGRIITADFNILKSIINKFSIYVENYFFMPAYKLGKWDGKIKFVKPNGIFYLGHFRRILEYIKNCGYQIEIDEKIKNNVYIDSLSEEQEEEFINDFMCITDNLLQDKFLPYTHQIRGALKSIHHKRGICEHITSSGKSLTITLVINYLLQKKPNYKILILVPKLDLIEQLTENMISFGIPNEKLGKFCGYQKDTQQPIIISTWQSLLKKKEFLSTFNVLIVDECHSLKADVVRSITEKMINAEFRLGFTGTMPDNKADFLLIEGVLGPIIDKVSYQELQEAKQISDIDIKILKIEYPQEILHKTEHFDYQEEKKFLEENQFRNNAIIKIALEFVKKNQNVLILVKKISHSENLYNMLKQLIQSVYLINGSIDISERNKIRKNMEESGGNVIVATVGVYSVGISIKRLHSIIFASAGKSKIQTLQSVGRGLRLHKTKNKLHLIDICENLKFSEDHFKKRLKFYKTNNFTIQEKIIQVK